MERAKTQGAVAGARRALARVMRLASFLAVAFLATTPLACGGATEGVAEPPEGGAPVQPPVTPEGPPAVHRPTADACPSHNSGGVPCTDSAECAPLEPYGSNTYCTGGLCGLDQCVRDADCGANAVCSCGYGSGPGGGSGSGADAGGSTGSGGYPGPTGNVCVPAACRVDADCGDGWCSPSNPSGCGTVPGVFTYQCHHHGDACMSDTDCTHTGPGYSQCVYDQTTDAWACSTSTCAG